ncbi:MAG: hypothetical protein OXC54_09085, partial [Rhodospirillaceae bacterium]|nr:hypothetical protein [Rhodospirillaceae bacterium]
MSGVGNVDEDVVVDHPGAGIDGAERVGGSGIKNGKILNRVERERPWVAGCSTGSRTSGVSRLGHPAVVRQSGGARLKALLECKSDSLHLPFIGLSLAIHA